MNTFNGYINEGTTWNKHIPYKERLSLLYPVKVPYELASAQWLYRWFIKAEQVIPEFSENEYLLCDLAADIHTAWDRKDYIEFKALLLEFIYRGKF